MIVPIALLVLAQTATAPDLPPGVNSGVVGAFYVVETKLQAKDFAAAENKADLLPKRNIKIGWDTSAVPQSFRNDYTLACKKAICDWNMAEKVHIAIADNPDITFSFVNALPKEGDAAFPAGATFKWDDGPDRFAVQIALHRLETEDDTTPADVHNEVAYAIGQYLGLTEMPRFSTFSTRTDQNTETIIGINDYEKTLVANTLDSADQLRALVASKSTVDVHNPELLLSTADITGVTGTQYMPLQISFTIQNLGDADLKLFVLPDCSCLRPMAPPLVKPHSTATIYADVNTADYPGHLNHSLMIYTNAPNFPLAQVHVQMDIAPLYRFVHSGPDGMQVGPNGLDMDVYLFESKQVNIEPLTARILGPKGSVTFQSWSGVLPFDEEAKGASESGYKFHIHFPPSQESGRIPATLFIGTANESFRELNYTFNLQKGIVALPSQLYLGRLNGDKTKGYFMVSRPGKKFHILKIVPMDPHLTARVRDLGNEDQYRVDVAFSGSYGLPTYTSQIKVLTDDPSYPSIMVPISGSGR